MTNTIDNSKACNSADDCTTCSMAADDFSSLIAKLLIDEGEKSFFSLRGRSSFTLDDDGLHQNDHSKYETSKNQKRNEIDINSQIRYRKKSKIPFF